MKFLAMFLLLLAGCAVTVDRSDEFQTVKVVKSKSAAKSAVEKPEPEPEPEDSQTIEEIITEGIHYWLSTKMTQGVYNVMAQPDSWWRKSQRVSMLETYFYVVAKTTMEDAWYNISVIIEEFRWLPEYDLTEKEFLDALLDAVNTYEYKSPPVEPAEDDEF